MARQELGKRIKKLLSTFFKGVAFLRLDVNTSNRKFDSWKNDIASQFVPRIEEIEVCA